MKGAITMADCAYTLRLAELPVRLRLHQPVRAVHLQENLCGDTEPAASVALTEEQWARAMERAEQTYDTGYWEFNMLVPAVSDAMLPYDRCLFHALAFVWRGKAYLFAAPSGTGKTTLYVLWKMLYGEEIRIINGDKPVLRLREDGTVWVYPSPWAGKESMGSMEHAPLGGIVILKQGENNQCRPAEKAEAAAMLYEQFLYSASDEALIDRVCAMETAMLRAARVWVFVCRGDSDSARTLRASILRDEGENDAL